MMSLCFRGIVVIFCVIAQGALAQYSAEREPSGPSSRKTGLAITEIMYNPRPIPGVSTNITYEFVEILNTTPWPQDLTGFRIDGAVRYFFPSNTVLHPGGYLVVARVPGRVSTNYAITNVLGPWEGAETNGLPDEEGVIQLRNRTGAVLLSINYEDSPPWPETADGTGHSLSLVKPSYGEDDFRAWAQSDRVGGSPGGADTLDPEPLASLFINEWQNHSDPVDWLELYNHSNDPVDMSGAWLSDDPRTNKFRIPNGTIIPPRGFLVYDQDQLNFELFAGGETILLWNSNQTRVIDVIDFRGQFNNLTTGRSPDGGALIYSLATRTPGAPNSSPWRYGVVITEMMYNPISGSNDDEYIEIHNRGTTPIDIAGWEFVVGISYNFPTNSLTFSMPPGAYWVLAKNPTNLMSIYTNLNAQNTFGPYGGSLANGGERVLLTADDYDVVGAVIEKLNVPVSEINYSDGGEWGNWSDGQGSSLELIDVDSDTQLAANWADSEDPGEALWTAIEYSGPLGESLGPNINDSLIIGLQGIGECLIDEVEVRADGGPNLVQNGGFEMGMAGWTLQGSHDFSVIENDGYQGAKSMHVRAASRGDNQSNRILSAPFANPISSSATNVSIRVKARWLRGHPEILLRLHGSATEAYGRMALPRRLGSPGAPNSRREFNRGPAIHSLKQTPVLPQDGQPLLVTAMGTDPERMTNLTLHYRLDPSPTYASVVMVDTGVAPDVIARDGIFTCEIPGQAAGTMVAFYLEGRDMNGLSATYPRDVFPAPGFDRCWPEDSLTRECLARWGEPQMAGDFATYHLWVSAVNSNRWHHRDTQNNTPIGGTFVYNNTRVIHNAQPLYSGSPWHRTNATSGPAGINRVDYEMNFPDDEPLLGATDFVLNNPGNPDILTISDLSAIAEQTAYVVFERMGLVYNNRRYIHFFVNGNQRSTAYERPGSFIFEDSQQPNGDMIEQWFPEAAGGQLFKVEDWFEFERNGFDISANNDADLARRTVSINGQPTLTPGLYRYQFRKRSVDVGGSANDFTQLFALIDAISPAENPTNTVVDPDVLGQVADWEQWMRHFAAQRALGNWDSYGWQRGKNDYLYSSSAGFVHMPWDIDYCLGLGRGPTEPLFESNDPRITAMFNTPAIVRAYWRAFQDLVESAFTPEALNPFMDSRVAVLIGNNINIDLDAVQRIKDYVTARRAYIQEQLQTVSAPFAIDLPAAFETTNNLIVISGTAPVGVKDISLNDQLYPVTWTTPTNFTFRYVLQPGHNAPVVRGLDRFGQPVPNASRALDVTYTGPVVAPQEAFVISEIQYAAPESGLQFVEIINRAPFNFDISGWRIEGTSFVFPFGSIATNGQILLLVQNQDAFEAAYGQVAIDGVLGGSLSSNGQALVFLRPTGSGDEVVDAIRYESVLPWPPTVRGLSIQVVDMGQDNRRASNWSIDPATGSTPGRTNSVGASLPAYEPVWLNEIQIASMTGPLDNMGEPAPWIELYNGGPDLIALDGYYLAQSVTSNLQQWAFPPQAVIGPGEHLVIWVDGEADQTEANAIHTDFRLEETGALSLVRLVDTIPQITDYFLWRRLGANVVFGSVPDGQNVYRFTLQEATPAAPNSVPNGRLLINEWMARNSGVVVDPADNQGEDWFEIYNPGTAAIDLGNYYLTDNLANPRRYRVPNNGRYRVAAGGFLLVWADNEPDQNGPTQSGLHVSFALGGDVGSIALFAPDGTTLVDLITYGVQTNNVSEGRYSDGATPRFFLPRPTPAARNGIAEYNSPPYFIVYTNRIVAPGQRVTVIRTAQDPDVPPQSLSFTNEIVPPGATNLPSGNISWDVPVNQPLGAYPVRFHVIDNGTPPRSDTVNFSIIVQATNSPPVVAGAGPALHSLWTAGGEITFTIGAIPGRTYRVLYSENLAGDTWFQLGPDIVAANSIASITDVLQGRPQRYYRVQRVN